MTAARALKRTGSRRRIGPAGTCARTILGLACLVIVAGHQLSGFRLAPLALGIAGFPAVLLGWQWLRGRRAPAPMRWTGPLAHVLNVAVFLLLFATPWYAPALWGTSDAALLFYGASMLLAALRGYAGCEVLAISNWLLRSDDQAGCLLFSPLDEQERRRSAPLALWARHDEPEILVALPGCRHVRNHRPGRLEAGCRGGPLAGDVVPANAELDLVGVPFLQQPARGQPGRAGGISVALVLWRHSVDKLHHPVAPVAEADLAGQPRMACLHDDQRRAVEAGQVPPPS
jgi:hypothetical protein